MRRLAQLFCPSINSAQDSFVFNFSRGLKLVLGVVGILVWSLGSGQSTIILEDFEDATVVYTTSVSEFSDGNYDYFTRTNGSTIGTNVSFSNVQGSSYFAAQDIDGGGASPGYLNMSNIDISGNTNLEFSVFLAEDDDGSSQDWDGSDYLHINYSVDNGPWIELIWIESQGGTNTKPALDPDFNGSGNGTEITDTFSEFTQTIPETGFSLDIQFVFSMNSGDEDIAIDDIKLSGISGPPCSTEPSAQATDIVFTNPSTSVDVSWTAGTGGDGYILVVREEFSVSWEPSDNNDYSGGDGGGDFSAATDQDIDENRVVYVGSGTSTTVTGLIAGNRYYFRVFAVCVNSSFDYLISPGVLNNGAQEYIVPLVIPDAGCGTNELEVTFDYTGGTVIGDVNLFVVIEHPYRGDLRIELESPDIMAPIVQVLDGVGGGADNLEVIFDDDIANPLGGVNHDIDGINPLSVNSTNQLLSNFDGTNPNGEWKLRVCDAFGNDVGALIDWSLDIEIYVPEAAPTSHPAGFVCDDVDIDEISLVWTDIPGQTPSTKYLVTWTNDPGDLITDVPIPVNGIPFAGSNALNIDQGIESATISGLTTNQNYFFKIFPYTNIGDDILYYTTFAQAQWTSCATLNGPCIDEEFDGGTTEPSGWNFNGITGTYTSGGNYGLSSPSVRFNDTGDEITTSLSSTPASELSFWIKGQGSSGSSLKVEGYDGSSWSTIDEIDPLPTSGTTFTYNFSTSPILPTGMTQFRFSYDRSSGNLAFDDVVVLCTEACTPTQSISSFGPHEGPEGTLVTVYGTGFDEFTTPVTDVLIGGNSTIYTVENDTTIQILIDDVPLNGLVSVIVDGCEVESINSFSYMTHNGNCSNSVGGGSGTFSNDLFISQVYDSFSGSLSYIEVFNGTEFPVDLDAGDYKINIETGATTSFDMSGTLGIGEVYILRIGTGTICSGVTPNQSGTAGFNGNDEVFLLSGSTIIDYAPNPEAIGAPGSGTGIGEADEGSGSEVPGFAQWRNEDAVAPNYGSYDSDNWTEEDTQNCDGISEPPYIPDGKNITITTQPADVDCDAVSFSVVATSTENEPSYEPADYVWRYTAPGDTTWSLVSSLNGSNGLTVVGSGFNTITITGNTSILFDYQFYVEIQTGGNPECKRYSNTASYTFNTKAFYRTVSDGIWSDLSIWEMADNEGGPYTSPVCQYPIDRTSDKISILHDVNLDVEIGADWIVVDTEKTLSLADSTELTIYNGNPGGPDLLINGTLIDNGNSANGVDFYNDESTWEMHEDATIIKTSNSYATRYRNAYHNGIVNIPDSATWIYRFVDNGHLSFASSSLTTAMYYPNLILENTSAVPYASNINTGNPNLSVFTIIGGELLTIKGDFQVGGNTGLSIDISTLNRHNAPVLVKGDLKVRSGSTLRNHGTGVSEYGTGFEVQGDLFIDGSIDLSGGPNTGQGVLKLSGGDGVVDQVGTGSTTVLANHLILDKTAGSNVHGDLSFVLTDSADFQNGILKLDSAYSFVEFEETALAVNASNASFVDGPVRKTANTSTNFTFPIGDSNANGNFYQPASIFDVSGVTTIEAQYFAEEHPEAGIYYDGNSNSPTDFREIGNCDHWTVNKLSGSNPRVGLEYINSNPDYCNEIGNPTVVRISRWNGFAWDEIPSAPSGDQIRTDQAIGVAVGSDYGDYVFSSSGDNLNALPITLTYFDAKPLESTVLTGWQTNSETDNDYFTIERSHNLDYFEEIGRVDGAGTSHSTLDYQFEDLRPYPGISYYRLKQTDFNGAFEYSDIQSVEFEKPDGFEFINAYKSDAGLQLQYFSNAPYLVVEIFDALGQRRFGDVIENYGGGTVVYPNLARGAYVVRLSHGSETLSRKFVW